MRKKTLGFSTFVLASAILVTLMFSGIVSGPAPQPPVEFDVNVKNTPLPVEVTNPSGLPIATNCTSVFMQGGGQFFDGYDLATLDEIEVTAIGDRTVVFTGGSLSSSFVFSSEFSGAGGATGIGVVTVWTTSGSLRFALPFSSMFKVEHVEFVQVGVLVYRPRLQGFSSYAFAVEGSVFWYIED